MVKHVFRGAMVAVAGLGLLWAGTALAAATPAQKCQMNKNKEAGKYAFCRQKAEGKLALKGDATKYAEAITKCETKYNTKWPKLEQKAVDKGGMCPSVADQAAIKASVDDHTAVIATALSGAGLPTCGGFPATGQTTAYGPGSDGDVQAGGTLSYTDNGDGTITDNVTGLMWEKKSYDGSIHDQDDVYTWGMTSSPYTMNGTIKTAFLDTLNAGSGFAGHTDWRIPNYKELVSILNLEKSFPAVSPAFNTACASGCTVTSCSCTKSQVYWSSTTNRGNPPAAWGVNFLNGFVSAYAKWGPEYPDLQYVRAVRGGL